MKKLTTILTMLILFLTGCSQGTNQESTKLNVVTTVYPLQLIAEEIGGDKVNVESIYPPGSDVHSYEPTAKDFVKMSNADIVFYISDTEDSFMPNQIANDSDGTVYINVSENESFKSQVESELYGYDEEEQGYGILDPHVWISPKRDLLLIQVIYNELVKLDATNQDYYKSNFEELQKKLIELDKDYTNFGNSQTKPLIITHDAYGYLRKDYGMDITTLYGMHHDDEPSAQQIQDAIDQIKTANLSIIYVEQNDINNQIMEQIAKETNSNKLVLNNMSSEVDTDEGKTLVDLLTENLEEMQKSQG